MKELGVNVMVVGFALFSMFFGAGNIIFPPFVGLMSGPEWVLGYLCYYVGDVGLALLGIYAMLRVNCMEKVEGLMFRLGNIPSKLMMTAIILCLGPLLAIPRTCATTFSMAVAPHAGSDSIWLQALFSVAFFIATYACAIRESKLVDIVGRYLTPLLVAGLLLLIIIGALNPIGPIVDKPRIDNVAWMGISYGYQTLDVFASMVFGLIVVNALKAKGYTSVRLKFIAVSMAAIIAGLLMLIVYGGLCYLGATVSAIYPEDIDKGLLAVSISRHIFGGTGSILLSIVVALACITTAVALVGSTATFFSTLTNGKWTYSRIATGTCIFCAIFANVGLNNIITISAPILVFLYPGVLAVMLLSLFDKHIKNDNVFRFAATGALAVSFCEAMAAWLPETFAFIKLFPLQNFGFAWVIPSLLFAGIGTFFKAAPRVDTREHHFEIE